MKERLENIRNELKKYPNGILITELADSIGMQRTTLLYYLNRYLNNEIEKLGSTSSHYPIRLKSFAKITSLRAGGSKTPAHTPSK